MSGGVRRGLANLACRLLQAALPPSLQSWGWAVRCETAEISDDSDALRFALDSLCGLMPRAIVARLLLPFAARIDGATLHTGGSIIMNILDNATRRPRALGMACAIGAVALGLSYMAIAGAPIRYLAINGAALVIGLGMLTLLDRAAATATATGRQWSRMAIAMMAAVLLATALLGERVDGAARWISLGGLAIQPSLILVPSMLLLFSRTRDIFAMAGILVTIVAMALQPDRAMAAMLALGLAISMILRRDMPGVIAFAASVAGFTATLIRADTLPATSYVDQILYSSFDVHLIAGMAVLGGTSLLLVPAIIGWRHDPAQRESYAIFGMVWGVAIMAAALGNYPTPIVGYGGSAIIGYALSLLALPRLSHAQAGIAFPAPGTANDMPADRHWRISAA